MPLDPAAAAVLDALQGAGAPGIETLDPPGARRVFERLGGPLPPDAFAGVVATAERVGDVPCVRVSAVEPREAAPVVIWVHGGGWVLGTAEGALDIATQLVLGTGCEVVCVDYRLAPEAPFPAALDDVTAVARSLVGGPTDRIVIAGDRFSQQLGIRFGQQTGFTFLNGKYAAGSSGSLNTQPVVSTSGDKLVRETRTQTPFELASGIASARGRGPAIASQCAPGSDCTAAIPWVPVTARTSASSSPSPTMMPLFVKIAGRDRFASASSASEWR